MLLQERSVEHRNVKRRDDDWHRYIDRVAQRRFLLLRRRRLEANELQAQLLQTRKRQKLIINNFSKKKNTRERKKQRF